MNGKKQGAGKAKPSDDSYRMLFDEALLGIKWVTPEGRLIEANRSFCELTGYDRDELLRLHYSDITHPDDIAEDEALFRRLLSGEIPNYSIDKRYRHRNGTSIRVRVTSSLARIGGVFRLSIVQDLRAQDASQLSRHEGEARLRAVLDTVPDAMVVIDERGTIESFSASAERIFGYGAAEAIGKNVKILMPSPDQERHDDYLSRYLTTGERHIIGIGRVVTGLRKDGATFPMELSIGEVTLEGRRLFTGFVRDISERERTERRIGMLQAELSHVSRVNEMGHMGSALAHELNQPLTAIVNYLQACQRLLPSDSTPAPPRVREVIEKAVAQADRAGQIIRRLRHFVEKRESERRSEDLNAVVQEAVALAFIGGKSSGIALHTQYRTDLPPVSIDRVQIQQVVLNLVRNAIEAMAPSNRRDLKVESGRQDGEIFVRVSDTGPGLAAAVAAQLFMPFVTTKESGMGIGLSISRTIIETHGGRIWADPRPEGGTVFTFTIPLPLSEREPS